MQIYSMSHFILNQTIIILYVSNQAISRDFYKSILKAEPILDVPGMTEFKLSQQLILGLMPEAGMAKILQNKMPHPSTGNGIPRCELYWLVDDINLAYQSNKEAGATLISDIMPRDWGDTACYFADPDGHIIAFAQKK